MSRRLGGAVAIVLMAVAAAWSAGAGIAAPSGGGGSLLGFGSNVWGQLASTTNNGMTVANPTPTLIGLPAGSGTVTQVAAGNTHSLAVTSSGLLYAFGSNLYGQLGVSTSSGTATLVTTPALVTLPGEVGPVTQIAAGAAHSLAVTASGQLYSFGQNQFGQLGSASNATPNPTPTLVTLPGLIGAVSEVAAGVDHSLVLTSSGQLYSFGYNFYGQLGTTTSSGTMTPAPVPTLVTLPGQSGLITQIAAGGYHSLVATASGQLYAFGWNTDGQLGSTTNNGVDTPNPTPTLVTLPGQIGTVVQISGGGLNSLAATSSGQLYGFGFNAYGELGNSTNNNTGNPNPPTLVTLPGQSGLITQIASGIDQSLVVTSSGQLYAFGYNWYGALGNATNNGNMMPNPTPTLVAFEPGTTIDTVAKGSSAYQTLAIVSDLAITSSALRSAQAGTRYELILTASGGTAPLRWSATDLPPGLSLDGTGVLSGTPTGAGGFSPVFTVVDAYGSSVSVSLPLVVDFQPLPPPPPPPPVPPRLTALKQSASKWLLGTRLPSLNGTAKLTKRAGVPVGTTFSFSLDKAARVTLAFRRTASGRRVAGACVAKTKGNASKPACTRTLGEGTLRVQAKQGTTRLHFEGRISRTLKLKAGAHSVTITAGATGKTSAPKTLHFTIAPG